jgi:3-phosphoshikimate 1-carboxyvinyltransferase
LIAAALSHHGTVIKGLPEPVSEDIAATGRCLDALMSGQPIMDCGESGTTLRLLIPVAAALPPGRRAEQLLFTGSGRLPKRPLAEYETVLQKAGLALSHPADACLPLRVTGHLQPGVFAIPGHISSQYISGLLLALPLLNGPSAIQLTTPLQSAPYVAMTCKTLADFGISVQVTADGFAVSGQQTYQPTVYVIERDYSQAAFWLVAAYGGCPLSVDGLPEKTAQGDQAVVSLLAGLQENKADTIIDAAQIPDLVPALAVAAVLTPSRTRFVNAERLRFKESDRLSMIAETLGQIGADIEQTADGLLIRGASLSRQMKPLTGGTVDAGGDHRIAMALAIAALFTRDGVIIRGAEAVRKSYPDFFHELRRLGGDVHELDLGGKPEDKLVW